MRTEYVLLVAFLVIAVPVVDWLLTARGYKKLAFKMQFLFPCKELEALAVANNRIDFKLALYEHHQQTLRILNFCNTCNDKRAKVPFGVCTRVYNIAFSQLNAGFDLRAILRTVEKGNEKIFRA